MLGIVGIAYAQDKQWSIELLHFSNEAASKSFVKDLKEKGFDAQVYVQDNAGYQVVMSGFYSYGEVLQAREMLLKKTALNMNDMHITTQIYEKNHLLQFVETEQVKPLETVIVHVLLNGDDAGTHFLQTTGSDFLVSKVFLEKIGANALAQGLATSEKVSLNTLSDWLGYKLDSQTGDLLLTVKPELLASHEESLAVKRSLHATWIQSDALFLNYTLDYNLNPNGRNTFTAPLELGLSVQGSSLVNQLTYRDKLYRSKTQWVYDQRDALQRWVVGDIQASSGAGMGGASLAGIRVFKNFSIDSTLVTTPGLEASIMLDTASEVEVFMDGTSVYKGNFPAGKLNLKDVPFYRSGSIQAEFIVRDVFGREQRYKQLLYGSTGMLAEGLSEYDYAIVDPDFQTVN